MLRFFKKLFGQTKTKYPPQYAIISKVAQPHEAVQFNPITGQLIDKESAKEELYEKRLNPAPSLWEIMESNRSAYTADLLQAAEDAGYLGWTDGPFLNDKKRKSVAINSNEFFSLAATVNELHNLYPRGNCINVHTPEHAKFFEVQLYRRNVK